MATKMVKIADGVYVEATDFGSTSQPRQEKEPKTKIINVDGILIEATDFDSHGLKPNEKDRRESLQQTKGNSRE